MSLGWNHEDGWIACGGNDGLLKAMKLDTANNVNNSGNNNNGNNKHDDESSMNNLSTKLSMQQRLQGHSSTSSITKIIWNQSWNKLTSTDSNGLIIVWSFKSKKWCQEMVNDRKESFVSDMRWNKNGTKICICYNDGYVIVGTVNGNREWGKQFDNKLKFVEWSPDGKYIIIVNDDDNDNNQSNTPILHDNQGNKLCKIEIVCNDVDGDAGDSGHKKAPSMVDIQWHHTNLLSHNNNNYNMSQHSSLRTTEEFSTSTDVSTTTAVATAATATTIKGNENNNSNNGKLPCLAIAFDNGRMQIMRDFNDDRPILIDTDMNIAKIKWNPNGTIIAVIGKKQTNSNEHQIQDKKMFGHFIQFFDNFGKNVYTLQVPCRNTNGNSNTEMGITDCDWECNGIRIAITVENFIYFAIVKTQYKLFTLFNQNTLCYSPFNNNEHSNSKSNDQQQSQDAQQKISVFFTNIEKVSDLKQAQLEKQNDETNNELTYTEYIYTISNSRNNEHELIGICGNISSEYCAIICDTSNNNKNESSCELSLCNSLGRVICKKQISFLPLYWTMTNEFLIVCNENVIYTYQHTKNKKFQQILKSKNKNKKSGIVGVTNSLIMFEKTIHIDQLTQKQHNFLLSLKNQSGNENKYSINDKSSNPIVGLTSFKSFSIVAKKDGTIVAYSIIKEEILFEFNLNHHNNNNNKQANNNVDGSDNNKVFTNVKMKINCDMTKMGIIESNGALTVYDISKLASDKTNKNNNVNNLIKTKFSIKNKEKKDENKREKVLMIRNDVWDMLWCIDNSNMFATMEKGKLFIFYNNKQEQPTDSTHNLIKFVNLKVTAIAMENLLSKQHSQQHHNNNYVHNSIVHYQCRALKDVLSMLNDDINDHNESLLSKVFDHINQHNRDCFILWRILAKHCLLSINNHNNKYKNCIPIAESCFVKCKDYKGIQFLKRLKAMTNKNKQMAEIYAFFADYSQCEKIYIKIGDINSAIDLQMRIGNWKRVIQLIEHESSNNNNKNNNDKLSDELLNKAYQQIGDYYFDLQMYNNALKYYLKCHNIYQMCLCSYKLENFKLFTSILKNNNNMISKYSNNIANKNEYFNNISNMLSSVGMSQNACNVLIKYGNIKDAILLSISLNNWTLAFEIFNKHSKILDKSELNFDKIVNDKINNLISKKFYFDAINIYFDTQYYFQCYKIIHTFINNNIQQSQQTQEQQNVLFYKKLYVLSAMAMDNHRKQLIIHNNSNNNGNSNMNSTSAIDSLLNEDSLLISSSQKNKVQSNKSTIGSTSSWHNAEAYHLWILLNSKISQINFDSVEDSDEQEQEELILDCLKLCGFIGSRYDNVINNFDIYNIYGYLSFKSQNYGECSKALTKLEYLSKSKNLNHLSKKYTNLSIKIFSQNEPKNKNNVNIIFKDNNYQLFTGYDICMLTGKMIDKNDDYIICRVCKHKTLTKQLKNENLNNCPLCHSMIN